MVVSGIVEGSSLVQGQHSSWRWEPTNRSSGTVEGPSLRMSTLVGSDDFDRKGRRPSREIVNRDEDAGGDTEPKTSNRANGKDVGSARGAERKVQGLSLIKSRLLGCSTVAAPERDQRCSETSGTQTSGARRRVVRGEREDAEGGDAGMG